MKPSTIGGLLIRTADDRVDGLVIGAFGAGHVPAGVVPALEAMARHKPVVLATRAEAGTVLSNTYDFQGSERDLLERGLISAGSLDAYKARALLRTLLATGATSPSRSGIRRALALVLAAGDGSLLRTGATRTGLSGAVTQIR